MILQQLCKDSERNVQAATGKNLPPPMYNRKPIRWIISLNINGELEGDFIPLQGEGKKGLRGHELLVPDVTRTSGIRPILLADKPEYTLGVLGENAEARHSAFKQIVSECARETQDPLLEAVDRFLVNWIPSEGIIPTEMTKDDLITFRVADEFPINRPQVQSFWSSNARKTKGEGLQGQCLICGETTAIVDRHPTLIKGIPKGQSSGTTLVGLEGNAFESFGLKNAFSSPACRNCGERYAKSLNALLRGERTHLNLGPSAFVFWVAGDEDAGFVLSFTQTPNPESVQDLLASYRKGVRRAKLNTTDFFATALTANSARAVVRDWLHTTIGAAQDRLAEWFARLEICDEWGRPGRPLPVLDLARSLYRDASKEMVAQVPRQLMRSALYGDPLPHSFLAQAVKRNRAERTVTYSRAALIKAVLSFSSSSFPSEESDSMTELTLRQKSAYYCGCLLAELEDLQRSAQNRPAQGRKVNTTLVDRFYGSASTTPANVFGTLLRLAQPHLSQLRKQNDGSYEAVQSRLEEVTSNIGATFPSTLTLKDQGYFSLGYYHRRASIRAEKIKAVEARKSKSASNADGTDSMEEIDRKGDQIDE